MSRRSSTAWRWSRFIARDDEPLWTERLGADGGLNWMVVVKPGRVRLSVEAYFSSKAATSALVQKWGGRAESFSPKPPKPAEPVRVSPELEIVHDEKASRRATRLIIPYGTAFGSGEHATTLMLLRALARRDDLARASVLDLGTGSGVLALAARSLGVRRIVATDFDANAIATAQRNEALNFRSHLVDWEVTDVKRLRARPRYSLVVANLFSGILVEAASRIARVLESNGELWLSGVLRSQQEEVAVAYRTAGLRHVKTTTRGKWVMQRWSRPA
jgi:ribosomal protein L11 methyltransferase